jgi:sugar lactone lactonase YvrE
MTTYSGAKPTRVTHTPPADVARALVPAVSRLLSTQVRWCDKKAHASVGTGAGAASARATKRAPLWACILAAACFATALIAGQTRTWSQSEFADFEKGVVKNLSLRSDGLLTLAPRTHEVFDAAAPYLWALARDSKGNLYAGGGTSAKLYAIAPDGKSRVVADLDALEIHAIAVDARDRVYAATSPDGKVYRIAGNGKPEVFYDPKSKYIWALAFDGKGNLYIATGDQGEIHRVTPDGKGQVFFKTDETHVRSMTVDGAGNLIVGTEPGGLVLRVSPAGEGFVLYQMSKREVTAVVVAGDGAIYAAGVGNRQPSPPSAAPAPPPALPVPAPAAPPNPAGGAAAATVRVTVPPPAPVAPAPITGGSEVYRIDAAGNPRRVWSHAQEIVYAIGFDGAGRAILGTGNKGGLYRIDSPTLYTALLTAPATQVTALQAGPDGTLYAATGNAGKVYEVEAGVEPEGTIESDVFDANLYTQWGRIAFLAKLNGGQVAVTARSGNLDSPRKNWSPWSAPVTDPKGGASNAPAARFAQWKATLTAGAGGKSPELESVDLAYLPKNVEPRVDEIEMTPPNYKFPPPIAPLFQPQQTLNLPALGARTPQGRSAPPETNTTTTPAMQLAKGWVGARWLASDPNGDAMMYTVEIRGVDETEWKPLKEKLAEKYYSWDSTAFPDGEYKLRVTASDAPANPPAEALTARAESDVFVIDNTPPRITDLGSTRNGGKLDVRWRAEDALNNLSKAEYSLDGGEWTVAAPLGGLSDALSLEYALALDAPPGEHTIAVRVKDAYDNEAVEKVLVRR